MASSSSGTEKPALKASFVWEKVTVSMMKTSSRLVAMAKLENGHGSSLGGGEKLSLKFRELGKHPCNAASYSPVGAMQ